VPVNRKWLTPKGIARAQDEKKHNLKQKSKFGRLTWTAVRLTLDMCCYYYIVNIQ